MHAILNDFLEKWVYPTGFTGPGVEFRLRQTERCLPLWDKLVAAGDQCRRERSQSGSDEYKAARARAGYAAEGPFMSLKQMSTQILSVSIDEQPEYIDLQRMRARQIWDEVKHGQLHADVLLRGGFIKREEELMDDAAGEHPAETFLLRHDRHVSAHPSPRPRRPALLQRVHGLPRHRGDLERHRRRPGPPSTAQPIGRRTDALHGRQISDRRLRVNARGSEAHRRGFRFSPATLGAGTEPRLGRQRVK